MIGYPWHKPRHLASDALSLICRVAASAGRWLWRAWWWAGAWLPILILLALAAMGSGMLVLGIVWVEGKK